MRPKSLALVDGDTEYTESLAQYLVDRQVRVDVFADGNALLAHPGACGYDFYVVDLILPGIDGVELIEVLRRRTAVGLLVVSGRTGPEVFKQVIDAGADMVLAKPVSVEQVALAIHAIQRRVASTGASVTSWTLDRRARHLVAPDGAHVELSEADLAVMECFLEADGQVVERETFRKRLGKTSIDESADSLNATIYRLRRRIERATPALVPLQAKSGVGYLFRAPLKAS